MEDRTVNIPLLRKAVEWAEAEAAKPYELGQWYQSGTVVPARSVEAALDKSPECGTCYCVAGYVAMVQTGVENPYDVIAGSVVTYAADQLGIDGGTELFAMFNSIEDVRRIAEDIAGERL